MDSAATDGASVDTGRRDSAPPVDSGRPDATIDSGRPDAVADARPDADAGGCPSGCPSGATCVSDRCSFGAQSCPTGQVATGFDASGTIVCAGLDAEAMTAVNDHCAVYFGWSDSCDACTTTPTRYGHAGPAGCATIGTAGTCATYTLGGVRLRMYGLNTEGSVNDDDKFNIGFHCDDVTPGTSTAMGACPAGQFVVGIEADGTLDCTTPDAAILDYANNECTTYLGWRDRCDGCTTDPSKSGRSDDASCRIFTGMDCDCTVHTLGTTSVRMFGLNTDGNVDGNDMLYASLSCPDVSAAPTTATSCAEGELAAGVDARGRVQCVPVRAQVDTYLRSSCHLYFGWRDMCDGCTSPPAKWGRANGISCTDGAGADNVCGAYVLGGESTNLFGLNLDGSVDGNDQFYLGFTCL